MPLLAGYLRRMAPRRLFGTSSVSSQDALRNRAARLGVRLTTTEVVLLESRLPLQDVAVTRRKFLRFARSRWDAELEREAFLTFIEQPAEASQLTKNLFPFISIVGTISWAIAGSQVAGDAGMNIVGCCLVGCVSSFGGSTLNNLMFGASKGGVYWARNPRSTVMVALASSVTTFFTWPLVCRWLAEQRLERLHAAASNASWTTRVQRELLDAVGLRETLQTIGFADGASSAETTSISLSQFLSACEDEALLDELRSLIGPTMQLEGIVPASPAAAKPPTTDGATTGGHPAKGAEWKAYQYQHQYSAAQLFTFLDADGNGSLDIYELKRLIKLQYDGSTARYMLDTVALGAASVTGTAASISLGLHPVVCVVSSVTMCFGGIIRDLMCNRNVAVGSQSFAASLAAGSSVYVMLREMALLGASLPLSTRILLSAGTTVSVRLADFYAQEPLLAPMHGNRPASWRV